MSTKHFTANVISASKVVPDGNFKDSKASGIWDINEALDLIKGGNWPNVANFNPASFVDALFSTFLYEGNGGTQTITNNINLSGSGGLVWIKNRDSTDSHNLVDTVRGATKVSNSDGNGVGEITDDDNVTGFTTTGFTIGDDVKVNTNNESYVSWTFRQQPKFFDVVKYSGSGSARTIAHSLGSVPGMIIVFRTDDADVPYVYHRGTDSSAPENYNLQLDGTGARADSSNYWNDTAPTSSVFSLGNGNAVNNASGEYVAYLFAHNDNDGGFGEPGDQDIIKCGTYEGTGSIGNSITLGFEPQWIIVKNVDATTPWVIVDVMRGMPIDGTGNRLLADDNVAEVADASFLAPRATGFEVTKQNTYVNTNNQTYVYVAIRRGGMQTPTAASDVFAVDSKGGEDAAPAYRGGFPVDLALYAKDQQGSLTAVSDRLRGPQQLYANLTNQEAGETDATFDFMNGFLNQGGLDATDFGYLWKRARGYLDIVGYSGTGSARTISHNLGAVPEMMWIKRRTGGADWQVYHSALGNAKELHLNLDEAEASSSKFNSTDPTSSVFSVGTATSVNRSTDTYIAYLFATVANVSKVGSFTQSGATNVACGFTGDTPSFILLKRSDSAGDWYLFDSARGIVAGNDKSFYLNDDSAEITNADVVDPLSGGFATTSSLTDGDYIFYAIAATS